MHQLPGQRRLLISMMLCIGQFQHMMECVYIGPDENVICKGFVTYDEEESITFYICHFSAHLPHLSS